MKKNILFVLLTVLLSSCFELDNYDAPDAGINGSLIDKETGEVMLTEQPDGCRIKLLDLGYENPTPLYFWVKANGTFRNVALFEGDYKVSPIEGPFFPVAEEVLSLKGVTDHNFKVTPYLRIKLLEVIPGEKGKVTVKFSLKRSTTPEGMEIGKKTISEAWLLCNTVPVVSYYNRVIDDKDDLSVKKTLSRTSDETIESKVQEITLEGMKSGVKYYLRLAALSSCSYNSTLKRYNYSEIFEFVAP
ncbi:DUF3823 domain-containing protein [Bacteroides salyersiae]|uniref:DUF3823 domain-containing protein n=1 Tax=Bacteroides salyersiae TaxID=291644 RepID=UPI0018996BE8|nr:DUF3823 domain-containing protein [Bacteroides salyersiae]